MKKAFGFMRVWLFIAIPALILVIILVNTPRMIGLAPEPTVSLFGTQLVIPYGGIIAAAVVACIVAMCLSSDEDDEVV